MFVAVGVPSPVEVVAAGFWINSMHDVLVALVHVVPKFVALHVVPVIVVPGEQSETFPLEIWTVAYEFVPKVPVPSPFVRKNVTPAMSEVTVALALETQKPAQLLSPPAIQ